MTQDISELMYYVTKLTKLNFSLLRGAADAVFQLFFVNTLDGMIHEII